MTTAWLTPTSHRLRIRYFAILVSNPCQPPKGVCSGGIAGFTIPRIAIGSNTHRQWGSERSSTLGAVGILVFCCGTPLAKGIEPGHISPWVGALHGPIDGDAAPARVPEVCSKRGWQIGRRVDCPERLRPNLMETLGTRAWWVRRGEGSGRGIDAGWRP